MNNQLSVAVELPERTDSSVVELSDAITFQWLYDGKAYQIEVRSSKREVVDLYIDTSLRLVAEWDRTQDFFSLQDISHPNFEMTPYLKGRLEEVLKAMKESGMKGESVIVMSDGFAGRIMQVLGRFFANQSKPINQNWVTDRKKGEALLAKYLKEASP